jgi:hypothetical protein
MSEFGREIRGLTQEDAMQTTSIAFRSLELIESYMKELKSDASLENSRLLDAWKTVEEIVTAQIKQCVNHLSILQ